MLKNAATKLAHNSTLPSLGNKDLKPLQDLIVAEKTVNVSLRKLSADLSRAADALRIWAVGEGDELTDILSASTELIEYFCTALMQWSSYQDAMREHMKAVRDREEALDDLKRRRKALVTKAESAEKKMEKMSADNKNFPAQNEAMNRMREQLLAMASEIMSEEASLKDYKRLKARAWMEIKFGGLLECCEKGTIVGEFGKLVISEISEDATRPGMSRPVYTNHAKIKSIITDASQCVESVAFSSFSPLPDSATLSRSHSRSSSVASSASFASSHSLSSESVNDPSLPSLSDSGSPPDSAAIATPSSDISRSPGPLKGYFSSGMPAVATPTIALPPLERKVGPISESISRNSSLGISNPRGGRFVAFPVKNREPIAPSPDLSTSNETPTASDTERRSSAVFIGTPAPDSSEETAKEQQSTDPVSDSTTSVIPVASAIRPLSMVDIDRHLSIVELHNPWSPIATNDPPVLDAHYQMDSFSSAVAAALRAHVSTSERANTADSPSLPTSSSSPSSPKKSPPLVVETASLEQRPSGQGDNEGTGLLSIAGTFPSLPTPLSVSPIAIDIEPKAISTTTEAEEATQPAVTITLDKPEEPLEEPSTPRARISPESSRSPSTTFGVRFSPVVVEIKRSVYADEEDEVAMDGPETPRAISPPSTSTMDKADLESGSLPVAESSVEVSSSKENPLDTPAQVPPEVEKVNVVFPKILEVSTTSLDTQKEEDNSEMGSVSLIRAGLPPVSLVVIQRTNTLPSISKRTSSSSPHSELHASSPNRAKSPPVASIPGEIQRTNTPPFIIMPRSSSSSPKLPSPDRSIPVTRITIPKSVSPPSSFHPSPVSVSPRLSTPPPRPSSTQFRNTRTPPLDSDASDSIRRPQPKPAFASVPEARPGLVGVKKPLPSSPYPDRRVRSATGGAATPPPSFSLKPSSLSRPLSRSLSATAITSLNASREA